MITLPKDWKIYKHAIIDRCRDLIDLKLWNGITHNKLDVWLRNFNTEEEKYFSACILDSIVYRCNAQTYSLIHQLLYKNINNVFRLSEQLELQCFPDNMISNQIDPLVRFVPVITKYDPGTKSANEILRFMKRHFYISEEWIIPPWEIYNHLSQGVKAFIFIDDFLGTGSQFDDICIYENLLPIINKDLVVYAPLVAHEVGVNFLKTNYINLKITCAEYMSKDHNSFFTN
jgi:hypothetical protein